MQRLRLGDCVVARSAMKPGGLGACPHSKTTLFHAYPNHNYACSIMLCPIEVLVNWVGVQLRMFSCLLFSYRVAQLQLVESFTCWIVLLNCTCSIWSWSTDLKGDETNQYCGTLPSNHVDTVQSKGPCLPSLFYWVAISSRFAFISYGRGVSSF